MRNSPAKSAGGGDCPTDSENALRATIKAYADQLHHDPQDKWTPRGVSQALRTGRTSCVEVTRACLAASESREHELHAWADLDRRGENS